jgi:hypothetical protein
VVDAGLVKRVLHAVAEAHPEEGGFSVARVDVSYGWGDLVNVTIHTVGTSDDVASRRRALRDAVETVLGRERFSVRLIETF